MKEEFKEFVRKRPELIDYVNNGSMTWQKFFEQWSLYGDDEEVWKKYKKIDNDNSFNFNSLINSIKNIDKDTLQKGINGFQKALELLQGLITKDEVDNNTSYTPRQIFKKFED